MPIVAGQKKCALIVVNRLDCAANKLHGLLIYYAILLALRLGCCYSVASFRDAIGWSRQGRREPGVKLAFRAPLDFGKKIFKFYIFLQILMCKIKRSSLFHKLNSQSHFGGPPEVYEPRIGPPEVHALLKSLGPGFIVPPAPTSRWPWEQRLRHYKKRLKFYH